MSIHSSSKKTTDALIISDSYSSSDEDEYQPTAPPVAALQPENEQIDLLDVDIPNYLKLTGHGLSTFDIASSGRMIGKVSFFSGLLTSFIGGFGLWSGTSKPTNQDIVAAAAGEASSSSSNKRGLWSCVLGTGILLTINGLYFNWIRKYHRDPAEWRAIHEHCLSLSFYESVRQYGSVDIVCRASGRAFARNKLNGEIKGAGFDKIWRKLSRPPCSLADCLNYDLLSVKQLREAFQQDVSSGYPSDKLEAFSEYGVFLVEHTIGEKDTIVELVTTQASKKSFHELMQASGYGRQLLKQHFISPALLAEKFHESRDSFDLPHLKQHYASFLFDVVKPSAIEPIVRKALVSHDSIVSFFDAYWEWPLNNHLEEIFTNKQFSSKLRSLGGQWQTMESRIKARVQEMSEIIERSKQEKMDAEQQVYTAKLDALNERNTREMRNWASSFNFETEKKALDVQHQEALSTIKTDAAKQKATLRGDTEQKVRDELNQKWTKFAMKNAMAGSSSADTSKATTK
mmetsp:Transcript_15304/g.22903  ORF Transcript_15304/g.22903 Transcript_15304/m.22903 type:complete len:514 (+) Transcript_15304:20-1561(+)